MRKKKTKSFSWGARKTKNINRRAQFSCAPLPNSSTTTMRMVIEQSHTRTLDELKQTITKFKKKLKTTIVDKSMFANHIGHTYQTYLRNLISYSCILRVCFYLTIGLEKKKHTRKIVMILYNIM